MLQISHLSKRYDRKGGNVLNDVSLSLPGEGLVFIFGDSGSGKTTFLECIGGLLSYRGKISFAGAPLSPKDVSFVFQNFLLDEDASVSENVAEGLRASGVNEEGEIARRTSLVLSWVGLSLFRRRPASALSSGQKQRLSFARALARDPKVILCDEPTGNLDRGNAKRVMALLEEASHSRLVIVVTHDLSLIEKGAECYRCKGGAIVKEEQGESCGFSEERGGGAGDSASGVEVAPGFRVSAKGSPAAKTSLSAFFSGGKCFLEIVGSEAVLGKAPKEAGPEEAGPGGGCPHLEVGLISGPRSRPTASQRFSGALKGAFQHLGGRQGRKELLLSAIGSALATCLVSLGFLAMSTSPEQNMGFYSRSGTVFCVSKERPSLSHGQVVSVLSDPESQASDPALIGLNSGLRPVLSWADFSCCHEPFGETGDGPSSIPCYFLEASSYRGTSLLPSASLDGFESNECLIDSSLLASLKGCYETKESFLSSTLSVPEKSASGTASSESYKVAGFVDVGFPAIFLNDGSALKRDYRCRSGECYSFSRELSELSFVDFSSMGPRYSAEKKDAELPDVAPEDNGGSICYMSDAAAEYIAKKSLPSLGLMGMANYRLVDSLSPSSLTVAIRDFSAEETGKDPIPSRKRLLNAFLSAISSRSYFADKSSLKLASGLPPRSSGEIAISDKWAGLFGGSALAVAAAADSGYSVTGFADGEIGVAFCSGTPEYLDKLVPESDFLTRFHSRAGELRSAVRFLSKDVPATLSYLSSFEGSSYTPEELSSALSSFERETRLSASAPYLYSCAAALVLLLLSALLFARAELNAASYSIGLERCLGQTRRAALLRLFCSKSLFLLASLISPSAAFLAAFALSGLKGIPILVSLLFPLSLGLFSLLAFALPAAFLLRKDPAYLAKAFD